MFLSFINDQNFLRFRKEKLEIICGVMGILYYIPLNYMCIYIYIYTASDKTAPIKYT